MTDQPIDFYASEPHFLDHLGPVWRALPDERRGALYYPKRPRLADAGPSWAEAVTRVARFPSDGDGPVVVASNGDAKTTHRDNPRRPKVLMQHGAGQSYSNSHPSYPGGVGMSFIGLFLFPNETSAHRNRSRYPAHDNLVVGSPRADALAALPPKPRSSPPTVVLSWHWDCRVSPEAGTAFHEYADNLGPLLDLVHNGTIRLLGHSHPRAREMVEPVYRRLGIRYLDTFEEVIDEADVYAVDNSSTLFEFAATGRPVVVINTPRWRRSARHGLRFWSCATIGAQAETPDELPDAVLRAIEDPPEVRAQREAALAVAYHRLGENAAERAAMAIVNSRLSPPVQGRHSIVVEKPRRRGGPVRLYRMWNGDFRFDEHDARRKGLLPDGPNLPKPVDDALSKAADADLVDLARALYADNDDQWRTEFLAAIALTRPKNLAGALADLVGDPELTEEPFEEPDEPTIDEEEFAELMASGRVGDVLEWVKRHGEDATPERAAAALAVELEGKARKSLVPVLEELAG